MGNLSSSIGVQSGYSKARQFARSPVLFASIQLGKNLQGFILNASEGGVCVQTAREIVGDEPLDLRFQSVRPGAWVNARGRIVWKNESNTVAGLQFIDADKEIAGEVRNWLNFGESLQELRGDWWPDSQPANPFVGPAPAMADIATMALPPRPSALIEMPVPSAAATLPDYGVLAPSEDEPPPVESPAPTLSDPGYRPEAEPHAPDVDAPLVIGFPSSQERNRRHSYEYIRPSVQEEHREKFVIGGIAGAACVLVLIGWFVFGHKNQSTAAATSAPALPASPQPRVTSSGQPAAPLSGALPASPVRTFAPPAIPPAPQASTAKGMGATASVKASQPNTELPTPAETSSTSGLILQVAAMTEEANANKLASSLKSEHFSAFVSKRSGDRFYRVVVGPFPSESPLREAAKNLKKSGFDSIEKHWAP